VDNSSLHWAQWIYLDAHCTWHTQIPDVVSLSPNRPLYVSGVASRPLLTAKINSLQQLASHPVFAPSSKSLKSTEAERYSGLHVGVHQWDSGIKGGLFPNRHASGVPIRNNQPFISQDFHM